MSENQWKAVITCIIFVGLACFLIGAECGHRDVRREAVRLNHAEYVPDEHGNPTFRWREVGHEAH